MSAELKSCIAKLSTGPSKKFYPRVRGIHAHCEKTKRQIAAAVDEQKAPAPVSGRITAMLEAYRELEEDGSLPPTGSLFEAKAGVKGGAFAPNNKEDYIAKILSNPYYKSCLKLLDNHLKSHNWGTVDLSDVSKFRKVENLLTKAFDSQLFTKMPLPSADVHPWVSKVAVFQAFATCPNWYTVGSTHMATMECRLLTSGSETIMGFSYDNVPGHTFKEKRAYLLGAPSAMLKQLLSSGGFALQHDSTKLVLLPSGFLYYYVCTSGCNGIRWSVHADEHDQERVKHMLSALLDSHPELAMPSKGHKAFLTYLQSDMDEW